MTLLPYDDRDGLIWLDGQMVQWREAKIHVLTHGLHYASAVFEGERAYGGRIFKLHEHSQRLIKSAEIMGMIVPYTAEQIDEACNAVLAANKHVDAYVRPVVWRGAEQMGVSAPKTKIHLAIATWTDWVHYFNAEAKMRGLKLTWAKWARPAPNTAPTAAKAVGNYGIATLCKHAAEAEGCNDALMLDWRGQVAEATGANFFMVKDGKLHTPIPECFLDGITRQTVIELARQRNITVVERAIWPDELKTADEMFLTGTAAEIAPITQLGEWSYKVGTLTQALMSDYSNLVRAHQGSAAA